MNKKEIMKLLKKRIDSCYVQLLEARVIKNPHVEGFRNRLDELILLYQIIVGKTFKEVCEEFGVKYEDVNVGENDE